MSAIEWERALEPALLFHVLAHLPLGRDAASLYDDSLPRREWVEGLIEAYAAAPGRLRVHGLGLRYRDADAIEALREAPPVGLRDPPGRRLLGCLLDVMASEREAFASTWEASRVDAEARKTEVETRLSGPLTVLREALWESQGDPPPLTVLDCPALRLAGRGGTDTHGHVVAVSLASPVEHLLCQILHEEVHPVTDPVIRGTSPTVAQDTRAGTPGHGLHVAIEHAAIEVGQALIDARAPEWSAAYARWRERFE